MTNGLAWKRWTGAATLSALAIMIVSACGLSVGRTAPLPEGGVFTNISGFESVPLSGEFTQPDYPIVVDALPSAQTFTTQARIPGSATNLNATAPTLALTTRSSLGRVNSGCASDPFGANYDNRIVPGTFDNMSNDWEWISFGCYQVGLDDSNSKSDVAFVDFGGTMAGSSTQLVARARASLPYRFSTAVGSVAGSPVVAIGQWAWMQASTSLPEPVTYVWRLGTSTISGANSNFYTFQAPSYGQRNYSVVMTGANGSSVTQPFRVTVVSDCPANQIRC